VSEERLHEQRRETGLPAEESPPAPPDAAPAPAEPAADPAAADAQPPPVDDAYLRLAADFDNYRKRAARERSEMATFATERLVKELLPVLDDLERALEAAAAHEEAKLEEGVRLVHRALGEVLGKEGVSEIEANGRFDPHVHEALLAQPSDAEEGTVIEVLQKGYRLGDRVVRPARVVVAAPQEGSEGGDAA
jgi:molecular chaperone GrpE